MNNNYIKPEYNAGNENGCKGDFGPLSDKAYIERRKERERELYADLAYLRDEVVSENLSNDFIKAISKVILTKNCDSIGLAMILSDFIGDIKAHVQEQAREDVDNENP